MKKARTVICAVILVLVCALALSFVSLFNNDSTPLLGSVGWDKGEIVDADGVSRPFDLASQAADWQPGDSIRLTGALPDLDELPDLYDDPGYLILDGLGLEMSVFIDGAQCAHFSYPDRGQRMDVCQFHLAITAGDAGKELEILYTPLDPGSVQYPFFARYSSETAEYGFSYATAARASLPAGAYVLGFFLILAIFFISVADGQPDWSLLLLAPVAFLAAAIRLNSLSGYYFLPPEIYSLLSGDWLHLLMIGLLLLYLFCNRKARFWRYLGRVTVCAAVVLVLWYAIDSGLKHRPFSTAVDMAFHNLYSGNPWDIIHFICLYLTSACGCIAAYSLVRRILAVRSRAATLSLRNQLISESYDTIRRSVESTALMRHEWKNQVTAMQVLAKQGDMGALGSFLDELDERLDALSPQVYCGHFAINTILQNAAARAERLGVRFSASALVPPELKVEEADLCSLLLNLLDNALDAAVLVPEGRRSVSMGIRLNQGYLSIRCENSYNGSLVFDSEGRLSTTKPERSGHGLGLLQIRQVAEKYRGMFDIQYTPEVFTATVSLKMPE